MSETEISRELAQKCFVEIRWHLTSLNLSNPGVEKAFTFHDYCNICKLDLIEVKRDDQKRTQTTKCWQSSPSRVATAGIFLDQFITKNCHRLKSFFMFSLKTWFCGQNWIKFINKCLKMANRWIRSCGSSHDATFGPPVTSTRLHLDYRTSLTSETSPFSTLPVSGVMWLLGCNIRSESQSLFLLRQWWSLRGHCWRTLAPRSDPSSWSHDASGGIWHNTEVLQEITCYLTGCNSKERIWISQSYTHTSLTGFNPVTFQYVYIYMSHWNCLQTIHFWSCTKL